MHKGKLTNINPPRITTEPKKLQDFFEKVGRVFRKLQSLFERYTTAFYNSTQFPYIFHQPWIGFILDFNLSLNRKNTLILFVKRIIAIKQ